MFKKFSVFMMIVLFVSTTSLFAMQNSSSSDAENLHETKEEKVEKETSSCPQFKMWFGNFQKTQAYTALIVIFGISVVWKISTMIWNYACSDDDKDINAVCQQYNVQSAWISSLIWYMADSAKSFISFSNSTGSDELKRNLNGSMI